MRVSAQEITQDIEAAKHHAQDMHDARIILPLVDLTSLNESDTPDSIAQFLQNAQTTLGDVAAVCVYPRFITQVVQQLKDTPIKVATVANFPQGASSLDHVMEEIQLAIQAGAQEVDVVFPYTSYLQGNKKSAYDFIRACKTVCGKSITLKVILETGMLSDLAVIAEVSHNVCLAGADFLKTSTGKTPIGATLEAACVMLLTIKELSLKLKRSIGFKASGGVRTIEQANEYIALAQAIMGNHWVSSEHFRLGASQLVENIKAAACLEINN